MSTAWHDKLLGGFKRTSDRLIGNLAGLGAARLDEATLDDIEEALIASDLGPQTAARIRARLAEGSLERNMEEFGIRLIVAEEIAKVLELSVSAVKSLLFRARTTLRESLAAYLES